MGVLTSEVLCREGFAIRSPRRVVNRLVFLEPVRVEELDQHLHLSLALLKLFALLLLLC